MAERWSGWADAAPRLAKDDDFYRLTIRLTWTDTPTGVDVDTVEDVRNELARARRFNREVLSIEHVVTTTTVTQVHPSLTGMEPGVIHGG